MLRFFRTRAPFFGLLLLVALLVTLPGIRHPLPMLGLAVFTLLAWRALTRWRARTAPQDSLDDVVARSAAAWDARHGPADGTVAEADDAPEETEPWRASLRDDDAWRARDDH